MKKTTLLLLVLLLTFNGYSQSKTMQSKWHSDKLNLDNPVSVDNYYYDSEQKVFYGISNNSENIVITMRIVDEAAKNKVLRSGITTWIDITAKNKKKLGVRFPLEQNQEEYPTAQRSRPDEKPGDNININPNEFVAKNSEIELIGFEGKNSRQILSAFNKEGVKGVLKYNDMGDLLYRLTVPFSILNINGLQGDVFLSINIESGEIDAENKPQVMPKEEGGGGRSSNGRMGGGPSNNGGPNHQAMESNAGASSSLQLKIKSIHLAKQ
jgi:hypothetical protein